ncbi:MAG: flagellar biosynthesis protein FlhB [Acidobacteria bacterium]|nr:flagellar biosynthesis protein FlhB [Acidobacteriota bacterium]
MAGGGKDNRSEHPTPRKLRKAREKGQVARSKEVSSAAVLLGGLLILAFFGQNVLQTLQVETKHLLNYRVPIEITIPYLADIAKGAGTRIAVVLIPVLLGIMTFSIFSNMVQGGLVFSTEKLGFHFEKLSPQQGLSKIFSKNGLVELLKSLLLLIAIAIISYQVISANVALYPRLVLMDVRKLFYWTVSLSYQVFIRVSVLLIILALADYFFQKYRFIEQLKMTKQEVKEEFKETEGDPIIKGRIRRIQREMARKRMMADVPTADVVITNPTHYSVALSYKMETMDAPKVVAKGVGFLALKIRELAQEHGIPLVENKPLAQTLYKSVEIGESIPGNLYKAVAEILAYIYKAKNALYR